jgi:hypothetical protein
VRIYGTGTIAAVLLLAGCYESPQQAFYEPGDYRGATDPLLQMQRSEEQQRQLRKRLELVQEDR